MCLVIHPHAILDLKTIVWIGKKLKYDMVDEYDVDCDGLLGSSGLGDHVCSLFTRIS